MASTMYLPGIAMSARMSTKRSIMVYGSWWILRKFIPYATCNAVAASELMIDGYCPKCNGRRECLQFHMSLEALGRVE